MTHIVEDVGYDRDEYFIRILSVIILYLDIKYFRMKLVFLTAVTELCS